MTNDQIIDFLRRGGQALVLRGLKGDKGDSVKGDKGDSVMGPANVLSIGKVTSGAIPKATITGTTPAQKLNLTLPSGTSGGGGTIDGGFPESSYPGGGVIDAGSP